MKFFLILLLGVVTIVSCSTPSPIVKSNEVIPNCHCEGEGDYTIVLEAGMGNWSLFYDPIFQALKKTTKVCTIDRAGYAMNTVSLNARDAQTVASEIEKSLKKEGITDNLILVGHSLGGLHVRMYQSLFPEKVKGIVLLDSAHPDQFKRLPDAFNALQKKQASSLDKVISLAQKDYLKYSKGKIPTFGIPENLLADYYNVTTKPEYYYSMKMEVVAFENSLNQISQLDGLGDLPLLVIGSKNSMSKDILPGDIKDYPFEKHNETWFDLQQELSTLSSNSTLVESNENHYLHIADSEMVVSQIRGFINVNYSIR